MTEEDLERIKTRTASKPQPSSALQAGGHGGAHSMLFEGARCLKPATAPRECAWYESLAAGTLHPLAAAVAPHYYGTVTRPVIDDTGHTTGSADYLVLENTTFEMEWFVVVFSLSQTGRKNNAIFTTPPGTARALQT